MSFLDMLADSLVADRNAARRSLALRPKSRNLPASPLRETSPAKLPVPRLQTRTSSNLALYLGARQMAAGTGFGALAALEMKRLAYAEPCPS